jgi:hypothetical protein
VSAIEKGVIPDDVSNAYRGERERLRQIGLTIDPAVAEAAFFDVDVTDPYIILDPIFRRGQVGREYVARNPGGEWVHFEDLPVSTQQALFIEAFDLFAGRLDEDKAKRITKANAKKIAKANKLKADLYHRKERNRIRTEREQTLVRDVQALDVDWLKFYDEAFSEYEYAGCDNDHTHCRRILVGMGFGPKNNRNVPSVFRTARAWL